MAARGMMIVLNGLANDSRVLKMAHAMRRAFPDFVLIGTYPSAETNKSPVKEIVAGIPCVKFPHYTRMPLDIPKGEMDRDAIVVEKRRAAYDALRRDISAYARKFRPTCLHTHDMFTLPIGAQIQHDAIDAGDEIVWIHDLHEFTLGCTHMPPRLHDLAVGIERDNILKPDRLITVTNELRQELRSAYPDAPDIEVIFNAPRVKPATSRSFVTLRDAIGLGAEPLAVYCGVVKPMRGVERMLPVLERRPDLHFAMLTGPGTKFTDDLKVRIFEAGLSDRVHWHPYVPPTEVTRFIASCDVGVIPLENYGNAEVALPNKLFEYALAGLPVVSSQVKAIAGFLDRHRIGLAVDFSDAAAAAEAIGLVLANRDTYANPALMAGLAREFAWEVQEAKLLGIYLEARKIRTPRIIDSVRGFDEPMGGLRVLHALTGAAGQPRALATALDALDGISARSVITSISSMGYEADAYFPLPRNLVEEQQSLIRAVIDDFDVFHFHYRSFFHDPEQVAFPVGLDLLMLKAAGKTVVVHFRGSEVRLQSAFAQKSPYHYVHEGEASIAAFPEPQKKMFIDLVSGIADRVYVTDPEIAEYVPGSVIMERAIDLDRWRFVGVDDTNRPLVVHAPSRQGVKGTASVLAAVERLKARGIAFDFELVEGKSNEEAKLRCQAADIVIDQLRIGWYGVLTVEAMALGKPVIVYIRDDLLHHLGPELPVAVANPETVEQVLEGLILSYDERRRLSARARAYCERVHGSAVLAERLAEDYRWMRAHPRPVVPGVVLDHMLRQYQIIEAERRAAAAAVGAAEAARAAAEIKAAALAAAAAEDAVAEKARQGEQAAAAVATTAKVPSAAQPIVLTPRQRARRFVKLVRTKGVGAGAKVVARKLGIRPATSEAPRNRPGENRHS